jgi:hypothetical protein
MRMPYPEAKAIQEAAVAACEVLAAELKAVEGGGETRPGLVPLHVRQSPEYQKAKREYDVAFKHMQDTNTWFLTDYKQEYEAELKAENKP